MGEVVIVSIDGNRLRLDPGRSINDELTLTVTVESERASITHDVWDYPGASGLVAFFRDLADAVGFDGERSYKTADGELTLRCVHDRVGVVSCVVTLEQPRSPSWRFTGEFRFGAGAHLGQIADEMKSLTDDTV